MPGFDVIPYDDLEALEAKLKARRGGRPKAWAVSLRRRPLWPSLRRSDAAIRPRGSGGGAALKPQPGWRCPEAPAWLARRYPPPQFRAGLDDPPPCQGPGLRQQAPPNATHPARPRAAPQADPNIVAFMVEPIQVRGQGPAARGLAAGRKAAPARGCHPTGCPG
jgi:hypothetical protein